MKKAFTLIEVMVSVMIISIVIMALLQMQANSSYMLTSLKKKNTSQQYISLLIANENYNLKDKNTRLNNLVEEFSVDDNLRRRLKKIKIKIIYNKLETIDLDENNTASSAKLEIGESLLKTDNSSSKIFRLRIKD